MRIIDLLAAALLLAAGAAAGLLAEGARRQPARADELDVAAVPFRLARKAGDPLLITPQKWFELPMLRGDFDLLADIELGEGATCDLLLRRVEPRPLQGVNLGFHGRFTVLRLSALTKGEPWRSPTEALLGGAGGLKLLAGSPATVAIKARGRSLFANVAGLTLPEYHAADEHGSLAICVRGGNASINSLEITPVAAAATFAPLYGAGAAGLLLAALALRRKKPLAAVAAAAVFVALASVGRTVLIAALPPLAQPELGAEWRVAVAGLLPALALLLPRRAALASGCIGVALAAWCIAGLPGAVAARFPPTPELDALLGPASRETAAEILAQRLRGQTSVHTVEPNDHRVLLLGGQLLYRRGAAPDQHVETLLLGELRRALPTAEVATLPTEDGWSAQQWRLFDGFLRGFTPQVLVLGVPRDEAAVDPATGQPRSTPAQLQATIAAARAACAAGHCHLVLLIDDAVPAPFVEVTRAAADATVPLVEVTGNDAAIGIARKLAAAIEPLLR